MKEILYRDAICEALDEEMARDENVLLLGEDVAFIGGNFKTSVGLYEKYGDLRVKDTPISEAGFVGMAVGMALTGLRPVVELMFSDFLLVAADQVMNQMAKIRYMSGGQATVPMVIRTPIGAGRSSAAQHSQSMQAMASHFPGIKIVVPSTAQEAKGLLKTAIRDDNPVIFFEHKMEYSNKFQIDDDVQPIPFGRANVVVEGADISIVATSSQVMKSVRAAEKLRGEGISCEVIDLRTIIPLDRDSIIQSVRKTGRLLIVDEAHEFCGIAAEIAANVGEDIFYFLKAPVGRIATPNVPLPFSPALEFPIIPSEDKIIAKARAIVAHAAPASAGAPGGRLRISPLAANMAAAKGIDPAAISGSGPNGRIMKRDVAAAAVPAPGAGAGAPSPSPAAQGGKTLLESRPYAGVRKIIGDRLAQSKFTAPHLYFTQKAVLDELLALRAMVNARRERKTSVTDFIAKAVVIALQKYPEMNASLAGDTVELYSSVNLGIAVAAPSGLIVPVVREAQGKSLAQISDEASALFEKARNGRLTPDEYSGGTFTISNLGMFGIENFTAIINPPESGILAISSTKDEAVVVKGDTGEKSLAIKPVMNITLSVDHRLIDGLLAASFVTEVKRLLESPMEILI